MWDRPPAASLMGSPYTCFQGACRAKRVALGNRTNEGNPFRWTWDYDPMMSKLYKWRVDGSVAGDLVIYIDDV
jgi:hypothetical protein